MSPAHALIISKVLEKGAEMLDAPISGNHTIVLDRKAATMVGGKKEVFQSIQPLLLCFGPRVTYVGSNGHALSLKIALNLSIAVQMLAFSEGVLLAEKAGVDKALAVEVMTHSAISSPMLQYRGPLVLEEPRVGFFSTKMMQKDVQLALDLGKQLAVPLPSTTIASEMLLQTERRGLGDFDFASLYHHLAATASSAIDSSYVEGGHSG